VSNVDRKELIDFIIDAIWHIEGVEVHPHEFWEVPTEELEKKAEWYDYLLGK
jgi:hypothetical protein